MILDSVKKAYAEIFKVMKKHKSICVLDIEDLELKSKFHLFGLELKEVHGLNINPTHVRSLEWIDCGEYIKIGLYGEKYNRIISWSDNDMQPNDEILVCIKFPEGAYMFGDGGLFSKDYPTKFFHKFWMELISFNPDYTDTHNNQLFWKIKNAKDIFNSFNDILSKYNELNKEDVKQRRIEKMKQELSLLTGTSLT